MSKLALFSFGEERFRLGSWRGDHAVGYLAPLCAPHHLSRAGLERALGRLRKQGYGSVLTAALTDEEQRFFLTFGFTVHERLHLLHHDLRSIEHTSPRPLTIRPVRRWHRRHLLTLDGRAFEPFWKLGEESFVEAVQATPATRVAGAFTPTLTGYAITGVAGEQAYLQRLAVDPDAQGDGLGKALVADALHWAARQGARRASVNTQEHNHRAYRLYERMGFARAPLGLAVLRLELASR